MKSNVAAILHNRNKYAPRLTCQLIQPLHKQFSLYDIYPNYALHI